MAATWIDISTPLTQGMAVWPGDPPTRLGRVLDLSRGDPCTVTALSLCAHAGTHLDAPAHYLPGGAGVEAFPSRLALGPARILDMTGREAVTAEALAGQGIRRGQRILLRTRGAGPDGVTRPGGAAAPATVTASGARFLAARGVALCGVDALSVGAADEEGDLVHRTLLSAGVWILEGLDLSRLGPGRVELMCLPLLVPGCDAAPVRAMARPLGGRVRPGPS